MSVHVQADLADLADHRREAARDRVQDKALAPRDRALGSVPDLRWGRERGVRCIRRARSRPAQAVRRRDPVDLQADRALPRVEHVPDLAHDPASVRVPVGRAELRGCFPVQASLRAELRDRQRVPGSVAADSATRRPKKAR